MIAKAAVALGAVALTFSMTGCTVPRVGLTGIGVDSAGGLVAYLQVCRDHVDGASVYTVAGDAELGAWRAPEPVTGFASWSLSAPSEGWTSSTALVPPAPRTRYSLFGWTTDNSSATTAVTFTAAQLASLRPGQVMFDVGSKQGPLVTDVATFRTQACVLTP